MTDSQTEPNSPSADIALKLSDDGQQLIAVVSAGENIVETTAKMLANLCTAQGYGHWLIEETALAEAAAAAGKLEQAQEFVIARRKDGELALQVADDSTHVFLSIKPPQGGEPVSEMQVVEALAAAGVTHGIKQDAIKTAVSAGTTEQVLIAEATLPVKGEDAFFENLIHKAKDLHPKINDDGSVDYHEISKFIVVDAGEPLMRKHPPSSGTDGIDVYGKVIAAKPGKDLSFASGLAGVEIDREDKTLLKATTGGQPKVVERGVTVSSVMNLKNVDLSSGNIHFVGTTNILGDVAEGMKVFATGDIMVSGMVEGAELIAGGNIVIKRGVIGRGELHTEKGEPGQGTAHLKSGGSVEARFIENAIVEAEGDVTVGELISHSEVSSLKQVVVGKQGAKKGHILGGKTRATMGLQAQVIGSQAGVKTVIEVGNNPELHKRVKEIQHELHSMDKEKVQILTLISRLRLKSDEKSKALLARVIATQDELNSTSKKLKDEGERLAAQDELTGTATVKVGKQAFSGVVITICDKDYRVRDRCNSGEFLLVGDELKFESR